MSRIIVVAKEKNNHNIQDIMEAARRIGCEIRWLHDHERAPYGSIAFYTEAAKGKWARPARRRIMIKRSFNECTFLQLVERVRNVIFPKASSLPSAIPDVRRTYQSDANLEQMRIQEIQKIRARHSVLY